MVVFLVWGGMVESSSELFQRYEVKANDVPYNTQYKNIITYIHYSRELLGCPC